MKTKKNLQWVKVKQVEDPKYGLCDVFVRTNCKDLEKALRSSDGRKVRKVPVSPPPK